MIRPLLAALLLILLPATAARAGEPEPFVKGTFATLRAAHAGRPLIVHVWGMSCGPCLAELPDWGQLAASHPRDLIVLVNADRPDARAAPRIASTLAKANLAAAPSFAFADRFEDRLRFEIDPDWQGELPRTLLIAGDGSITALPGVADLSAVRAWIAAQVTTGSAAVDKSGEIMPGIGVNSAPAPR